MSREEQTHIDNAYANIYAAMNELAQVFNKDKYLIQIQSALYKMEDMMYQYATDPEKRRTTV